MFYDEESRLLITGGKDRTIKFWRLPERWTSEEVERFEETEIKVGDDLSRFIKIQQLC
jgi:hypothetical protein